MATVKYQAHCSNIGWQNPVEDGQVAGTIGQHCGLECFRVTEVNIPEVGIQGFAYVSNLGWSEGNIQNEDIGSTGLGLPIEAVKIGLFGARANEYDIFYRLHVAEHGFLNWSKNGELNGTVEGGFQAEAIQIEIHHKSENWYPVSDKTEQFIDYTPQPQPAQDKRAQALALAASYVGYVTPNPDDSIFGRRYAGVNAGAWCAYAVRSICDDCGIEFPATGYVPTVEDWARSTGRWTGNIDPNRLQAVIFDFNANGTGDHIGLVESPISGGAITLEGNTSGSGGTGYWRKTRTSGIRGFVNLT